MSVASPFFFLFSLFIAAFILLYFFRKSYEQLPVSSNMLWEQVLNERQASPWLQKLQHNLLFWLQLLILVLIMLALTRPYWYGKVPAGDHFILVVDTSATMSAKEGEKTRFAIAKEDIFKLLDEIDQQEVTIISTGQKPKIIANHEQDQRALRKAIQELELSYEYDAMDQALELAESLVTTKDSVVHLFSDHVVEEDVASFSEDQSVFVHNYNSQHDNLSLLSFGTAPEGEKVSAVAVIANETDANEQVDFQVMSGETLLFSKKVHVVANQEEVVNMPTLPAHPYYQAVIRTPDDYEADNELTAISTTSYDKVYAVGDVNPFYLAGLQTLGLEVIQVDDVAKIGRDGMVIAEGVSLTQLGEYPLLFIQSEAKKKQKVTETLTAADDPLFTHVDSKKVYIASAFRPLNQEWQTILASGDQPLIQKGTHHGYPIIALNFALSDTDWPLQPGFPLFLYNSYQWLTQQTNFLGYYQPGEEKWLNLGNKQMDLSVFTEDGDNLYTINLVEESFIAPVKPGVYEGIADEQSYYFSVLLDEREKSLEAAPSFAMNPKEAQSREMTENIQDHLWFWLACIALLLLMAEWEVYRRGY
ncbi:vWA domain-containing protein [Peribacillus asahii]|uniref:vWA domain-containing protein n=1 Tax=Peribacillus asahii TaxID=228899 RepID=UPI0020792DEA|nr:VWA domain-containing protein [Peribacillus asahii]USK61185.1 VWA domain-containing protein [Peribacillus asahii]